MSINPRQRLAHTLMLAIFFLTVSNRALGNDGACLFVANYPTDPQYWSDPIYWEDIGGCTECEGYPNSPDHIAFLELREFTIILSEDIGLATLKVRNLQCGFSALNNTAVVVDLSGHDLSIAEIAPGNLIIEAFTAENDDLAALILASSAGPATCNVNGDVLLYGHFLDGLDSGNPQLIVVAPATLSATEITFVHDLPDFKTVDGLLSLVNNATVEADFVNLAKARLAGWGTVDAHVTFLQGSVIEVQFVQLRIASLFGFGFITGTGTDTTFLEIFGDTNSAFAGVLGEVGTLRKTGGGELLLNGAGVFLNHGLELNAGTLSLDAGAVVAVGVGFPGTFTINGGTLHFENPAGANPVAVSGPVNINGGTLSLNLASANPTEGDRYTVIATLGFVSGAFDSLDVQGLNPGSEICAQIEYFSDRVDVVIVLGEFNLIEHPRDAIACEGGTVTFTVVAETPGFACGDTDFQWRDDGVDIPGATGATYVTGALSLGDDGSIIDCVVLTPYGLITSDPAVLHVQSCTPILRVESSGPIAAGGDGASWATALASLPDSLALAASSPGTVEAIWVAEGVYAPDDGIGQIFGDRNASVGLIDNIAIYGGFPAGGGDGSFEARDPEVYLTILSGAIGQESDSALDFGGGGDYVDIGTLGTFGSEIGACTIECSVRT